jgi:cytochrome d ubiquinol oxidase subunit I
MAGNRTDSQVRGIIDIQEEYQSAYGLGNYVPPVALTFWSFRILIAIGLWIMALTTLGVWFWWKGTLEERKFLLNLIIWSWPLPNIANSLGWVVAEVGRQPWLVFGLQRTEQGLSKIISSTSIWITCLSYTMLYALIAIAAFVFMRKIIRSGPIDEGG